ncbi:hypothetical protein [Reichenbachiella sp. MALMAid0571]|uniref:hypothetical protein n=1 Tax=Reichenbachiella sp. MALMAid0571 TaxID=3143939 RepID=UPI0032E04C8C
MNRLHNILKHKTLLIVTGVVIALAIVSVPVLKNYVTCPVVTKCEQTDKQEDKQPETQVSSFDAVAPVLQINFNLEEILIEVFTIEYNTVQSQILKYISETPEKFLKILFRWIISPNAP